MSVVLFALWSQLEGRALVGVASVFVLAHCLVSLTAAVLNLTSIFNCSSFCVLGVWCRFCCALAANGMKPKAITDALSTLHDQPINLRAVQNASAAAAARAKASAQEVNKLYADLSKNLNEINSILLDSVPPALARDLVQSWLLTARMLAKSSWGGVGSGGGGSSSFAGLSNAALLPPVASDL